MLTYGFYNSVNHDRTYNAEEFSKLFDGLINDGVYERIGQVFAVTPSDGMVVNVGSGRAWFNHTWTYNDSTIQMVIPESDLAYDRIDAVVIEVNSTANVRANTIKVIKGIPSASPEKPILTNTDGIYQHALAYITVEARSTSISGSNIENAIGTDETPFVDAIVRTSSISNLWGVWKEEFDAWLQGLRDELDENQAGHLQNEIDALDANVDRRLTTKEDIPEWDTTNVVLSASNWDSTNKTYSLEERFPSSQYRILNILPISTTTETQLKAWNKANCTGHYNNNVMKAKGTVPSTDINIGVQFRLKGTNEAAGMDINGGGSDEVSYAERATSAQNAQVAWSLMYSQAFEVKEKTYSHVVISESTYQSGTQQLDIEEDGYTPIGILGITNNNTQIYLREYEFVRNYQTSYRYYLEFDAIAVINYIYWMNFRSYPNLDHFSVDTPVTFKILYLKNP